MERDKENVLPAILSGAKRVLSIENIEGLGHKKSKLDPTLVLKPDDLVIISGKVLTTGIREALENVDVDVIYTKDPEYRCSIVDLITTGIDNARSIGELRTEVRELREEIVELKENNTKLELDLKSERDRHAGVEAGVKMMLAPILERLSSN